MKLSNICFALPPGEAQALHDFLVGNGVLCPGPRYNEKTRLSHIVAVNRGTEGDVRRAQDLVTAWRNSRGPDA